MELSVSAVEAAFQCANWGNTTETPQDWVEILCGNDDASRQRLFEKIFREDSTGLLVKGVFAADEVRLRLAGLDRPYHRREVERRRLVWRAVYLDIPADVPELAWVILPREGA